MTAPARRRDNDERLAQVRPALVAFLARRVGDGLADELAQDVLERVIRVAPDCPDDASFRGYVFVVARRRLIDHHRLAANRVPFVVLDGGEAGPAHDGESAVAANQVLAAVQAELDAMKPELADVFRWRTSEDVSFAEIAARQRCGINTALGRMHRATKRIAEALAAHGWIPKEDA